MVTDLAVQNLLQEFFTLGPGGTSGDHCLPFEPGPPGLWNLAEMQWFKENGTCWHHIHQLGQPGSPGPGSSGNDQSIGPIIVFGGIELEQNRHYNTMQSQVYLRQELVVLNLGKYFQLVVPLW